MVLFLCGRLSAQEYTVSDTVPDFMDLTAACVVATYGTTENPFANTGIRPDRHQVITGQGTDPYTGDKLNMLPPEASQAIQLGNSDIHGEAESISYYFKVDPERSVLLLKFASVLENSIHNVGDQPRFSIRVLDEYGNLVESCAEYDISARGGMQGVHTFGYTQWSDWASIGLDLSRYAGRTVQVQFITYDCAASEHFGYAYFTASCIPHRLSVDACTGSAVTLSAPAGFTSYLWDDGTIAPSRTVPAGSGEQKFSCELISVTGCIVLLGALCTSDIPSGNLVLYDTLCQGDPYLNTYYVRDIYSKRPALYQIGHFTHTTTFVDPAACTGDVTVTKFVTVQQRFYPVTESICHGEDFQKYGFDIRQPPIGTYRDSLYFSTPIGCDSIVTLTLHVSPSFSSFSAIQGEQRPCGGSVKLYTVPVTDESAMYTWQFPEGYYIVNSSRNGEVQVAVTNEAQNGDLVFTGVNGCESRSISLPLYPYPAYSSFFTDTICTGTEYRAHGFTLPAADSAGRYRYTRPGRTVFGCDSNILLELYVHGTPSVGIAASDSVLCNGDAVVLQAATGKAVTIPPVVIGDIYCTDKTIVKPEEFSASGKTALGVVFWVHPNGKNGWMVSLKDGVDAGWADQFRSVTVPGLPSYQEYYKESYRDTNGYANTAIIRSAGDSTAYPAVYNVDFDNGWYLPASLQIEQLHAHAYLLKASLELVNGEPLSYNREYWSSTLIGQGPLVHQVPGFGYTETFNPRRVLRVRPICSF